MKPEKLSQIINKILNPLKGRIPIRDFNYLEIRMLEIGATKIK